MAFSGDPELMGEIACDHKLNKKTALTNDFNHIFTEMQDAAAHLDAAAQYVKLRHQSRRSIPCNINQTDIVENSPPLPDNAYSFDRFEAMFSTIDINSSSDPNTLLAFVAHQQQRTHCQSHPCCDPSIQLENNVYAKMPKTFKD